MAIEKNKVVKGDSEIKSIDFSEIMGKADIKALRDGFGITDSARKEISHISDEYRDSLAKSINKEINNLVDDSVKENISKLIILNKRRYELDHKKAVLKGKVLQGGIKERVKLRQVENELDTVLDELVALYDDSQKSTLLNRKLDNISNNVRDLRQEFDENVTEMIHMLKAQVNTLTELRHYVLTDTNDIFYIELCKKLGLSHADRGKVQEALSHNEPIANYFVSI